jgi:hypothetical protein
MFELINGSWNLLVLIRIKQAASEFHQARLEEDNACQGREAFEDTQRMKLGQYLEDALGPLVPWPHRETSYRG